MYSDHPVDKAINQAHEQLFRGSPLGASSLQPASFLWFVSFARTKEMNISKRIYGLHVFKFFDLTNFRCRRDSQEAIRFWIKRQIMCQLRLLQ